DGHGTWWARSLAGDDIADCRDRRRPGPAVSDLRMAAAAVGKRRGVSPTWQVERTRRAYARTLANTGVSWTYSSRETPRSSSALHAASASPSPGPLPRRGPTSP